jgi:hypothetical protein
MYVTRKAVCLLVFAGGVGCRQSDRPAAVPVNATSTPAAATPQAAAALVPGFLGCYEIHVDGGLVYRVRLTDTTQGPTWVASSYGSESRNAPGDQWSWAPTDSTRFTLEWGGIDGAMGFVVVRQASDYVASGQLQQTRGPTDLHPTVRRVDCPPPAV